MRIAVIGAGALGSLFAEGLGRVADLLVVDRSRAPLRPGHEKEPARPGQPLPPGRPSVEPVEVALVCVKSQGTEWAAEVAAHVLADDGVAVTLQNGLGHLETLARVLGPRRTAQGATTEGAFFRDGRVVRAGRAQTYLAPHPDDRSARPRLVALAAHLLMADFPTEVVDDARDVVWRKLVVNAAINPLSALLRLKNGDIPAHPAAATADELACETARVGRALGVAISDEEAVALWRGAAARTSENRSSMLQDVERGRPTEIDAICGAIAREGARLGIATPLNAAMATLLPR